MKIIITGASGFVGEGVLLECLSHPRVSEVLMVNRKHIDLQHAKLKELIVPDFFQLASVVEQLRDYDSCFYCAGISSAGMNEQKYTHITYDTTMAFAGALLSVNKKITFCFISGRHTDSTGKGKMMWARVKGNTENALMQLPFAGEYNFRPGGMIPTTGQKNAKPVYKFIVKVLALFLPKSVTTLKDVCLAMIQVSMNGYPKQVLEVKDIIEAANGAILSDE